MKIVAAILGLTAIAVTAMATRNNGVIVHSCVTAIGGLAGYVIGSRKAE